MICAATHLKSKGHITNIDVCMLILLKNRRNDVVDFKTLTYKFVLANHPEEIKISHIINS